MMQELQQLSGQPGEYSFSLASGSRPLTGYYRVPDPGQKTGSRLPSARLIESLFRQAGLDTLALAFDQMEKDLLYAKASTYEWPRFLAYASERKVPEQQARKFYGLIRGGEEHKYSLSLRDAQGDTRYQYSFSSPLQFIQYQQEGESLLFISQDSAYYSTLATTQALPLPAGLLTASPERLLVRMHGRWLALSRGDHVALINLASPKIPCFSTSWVATT
ncbi:hypothetical protein [Cesiribacter andamanensis]|uniref:Uncharacterized protein n=1 Tax=Cesiribacter andamanensis AMV16 TaxID=1279009 RepID=M7N7K4_9BACT|nr:hypothetical protein [Cesiribacter andamanensis]EMR03227.1 hypothetical protein ADICEAN_01620 [Cesiribacter andamanensis AMV16]